MKNQKEKEKGKDRCILLLQPMKVEGGKSSLSVLLSKKKIRNEQNERKEVHCNIIGIAQLK